MHIILDSNVYGSDLKMGGINFKNLFSYVRKTKSTIILPRIVREEVVAVYRRRLEKAGQSAHHSWLSLKKLLISEDTSHFSEPDYQSEIRSFRKKLREPENGISILNIVETDGVDLTEVFLRGIHRRRPASDSGEELRDVILWLYVLAYAHQAECPVVFISGDSGFWDGEQPEAQILTDIAKINGELSIFKSIDGFISHNAPEPTSMSNEMAREFIDVEQHKDEISKAIRQALSKRYRGSNRYDQGAMNLTSHTFRSGELYLIEDAVEFAEINYEVSVQWDYSQSYPRQIFQPMLFSGVPVLTPTNLYGQPAYEDPSKPAFAPGGFLGSPINVWSASNTTPEQQNDVYIRSERITANLFVMARINENSLEEFEVHEVTIEKIEDLR